jgi:replication-associated recombination protein RarA
MEENLRQLPNGTTKIIKIALFGPGTGKTTLARQLAIIKPNGFQNAREYLQKNGIKTSKYVLLMICCRHMAKPN